VLKSVEVGVAVAVVVEGAGAGVGIEEVCAVCALCGRVNRTGLVETDLALRFVKRISGFPRMEVTVANTFPSVVLPIPVPEPVPDSMNKRELSLERLDS
jgi:hypothetical protein